MYQRYFELRQNPFSIAPDPRYLFMSERHREALAHLLFGIKGGGGFVLLTGEIGAGKTTVCRLFLEQIPSRCNVAYLFNPKQTVTELLQSICDEFGVPVPHRADEAATVKDFIDPLNAYLLATHAVKQNNVLIIDEAQNLSADVLEQLRLLTNLETNERKLLQIILIGQPELRTMLARPELEQLAQRVIARFHLAALSASETAHYIAHRLAVAGSLRENLFSVRALRRIHQRARGIPRRINLLCDRALLGAYAAGKHEVDVRTVEVAAREVFGTEPVAIASLRWRPVAVGMVAGAVLLGGAMLAWNRTAVAPAALAGVLPSPTKVAVVATPVALPPPAPVAVGAGARELPAAFRRLAQFWQLRATEGDACKAAREHDVYCFSGKGLTEVRLLDRPAILTLQDDDGKDYYAVLTGLSDTTATLQIDGVTNTVNLAALARRWEGDFSTMWRGPSGFRRALAAGDRGAVVDWLATLLAQVDGVPPPPAGAPFDAARVRRFQLIQGLKPDGVAGSQTLIRIALAAGVTEPHLPAGPLPAAPVARK